MNNPAGVAIFTLQSFDGFDPDAKHLWIDVRVLDTKGTEVESHRDLEGSHNSLKQISNTMGTHFPNMVWVSNIVWLTESLRSILQMQPNTLHFASAKESQS